MLRSANLTFGGGTATAEVIRRSITRRGWLADEEHRTLFALSRLTPGTNLLAYCTAIGWVLRGSPGAVVSLVAASLPSSVIAVAVTAMYDELVAVSGPVDVALLIAMTAALLLLISSAWHLARPQLVLKQVSRPLTITLLIIALSVLQVSPVVMLAVAGVVGALWLPT
jgi:chromate transporter